MCTAKQIVPVKTESEAQVLKVVVGKAAGKDLESVLADAQGRWFHGYRHEINHILAKTSITFSSLALAPQCQNKPINSQRHDKAQRGVINDRRGDRDTASTSAVPRGEASPGRGPYRCGSLGT